MLIIGRVATAIADDVLVKDTAHLMMISDGTALCLVST
jgi:hypothetical protein